MTRRVPWASEAVELALVGRDGTVVWTNPVWRRHVAAARPPSPPVGADFVAVCDAAGGSSSVLVAHAVRSALRGGHVVPVRFEVDREGDGQVQPCLVEVSSRYADDGSCTGATVTYREITEPSLPRPDADSWTRLVHHEQLITHALDTVDDVVVLLDAASLAPVYANRAGLAWLRPGPDGEIHYGAWNPLGTEQLARVFAALEQVATGRTPRVDLEVAAAHEDGTRVWLDVRLCALASRPGEPPGYLLVVANDVTSRVAAHERLQLSETSFRAAFEGSPIGTVVTSVDEDGTRRIAMANEAAAEILGRPLPALVGSSADDLYGPDEAAWVREITRTLTSGESEHWQDVRPFVRPDGSSSVVDVFVTPIELAGQDRPAILAHVVDVTAKARAELRHIRRTAAASAQAGLVTAVLAGEDPGVVEQQMLDAVRDVFGADDVLLAVHDPSEDGLVVALGAGPAASALARGRALLDGAAVTALDVAAATGTTPATPVAGLVAAARFDAGGRSGWVGLGRRSPLEPDEGLALAGLVRQAATAVELGRARADQDRLGRLEERQRLARDLHDTVLQDLIAMGVQLGLVRNGLSGAFEARVVDVMRELVETVRKLRSAVFQLRRPLEEDSVEDTVRAVVSAAARVLGHQPVLAVTGDLDAVPPGLRGDLAAALQEALSNVMRHADATETSVTIDVSGGRLLVVVTDDGDGGAAGGPAGGQGLANLAERARAAGGSSLVRPGAVRGTVLTWSVPVPG